MACGGGDTARGPRVVCVSKQINEFLYDIHAESVLVARDLTSVYPPGDQAAAIGGLSSRR